MIVLFFDAIFFLFTTLSTILARLFVFSIYLFVQAIQVFKVPGETIQAGLEQVAEFIKTCFEFVFGIIIEIISAIVSALLDNVKEAIKGSAAEMVSKVVDLMENTRNSLDGLLKDLPEIGESFLQMIQTVIETLWDGYKDSVKYLIGSAD
ncbi:hypothetical protein SLEP1_g42462 [Rubroshorea leprosula]|uniref:Uncharacterized protein n=1 Tax=Rubroshorea leprosula TaxID=152421 RepID=A0AAV5LA50_9ROSI|nr:hypothetical protein SLEP1_g42462 [Rubroshorea leprosula]